MKTKLLGVVASLAIFAAVSPASANLIINGSFETGSGDAGPGGFSTLNSPSTNITGWTVTDGSVDWINGYWQAQAGTHSVDMNGLGALGSIQQNFNVTNGGRYLVSFWLAGNPDGPPPIKSVGVDLNNDFHTFTFDSTGKTHGDMGWQQFSFTFTAIEPTETLKFVSLDCGIGGGVPCSYGAAIDNVSVSAVPEISTWGMMLLGFAGIGLVAYRRSRQSTANIGAV
jgi:choice-of-anchor C domain-containing protein